MTVDAVGAHFRCVRERFPRSRLGGHPSDCAKAYKQCPLDLRETMRCAATAWEKTQSQENIETAVRVGGYLPKMNRRPFWELFGQAERLSKAQRTTAKPGSKQDQLNVEAMFAHLAKETGAEQSSEDDC